MPVDATVSQRFAELATLSEGLPASRSGSGLPAYETKAWQQWATSAQHIIRLAVGDSSSHAKNFATAYAKCKGWIGEVDALKGIFLAARADYDGGYATSLQVLISGEIYGDFVALAKATLTDGAKDVSAVLACAALEDALKRYAAANDIDVDNRTMQDVVEGQRTGDRRTQEHLGYDAEDSRLRHARELVEDIRTRRDSVIGFVENSCYPSSAALDAAWLASHWVQVEEWFKRA